MTKIKIDTTEIDDLILDMLIQSCGNKDSTEIDNKCLSAYENVCDYLAEKGYIQTTNGRIYTLSKKIKERIK
jgi:hypothetical protein